MSDEEIAAFLKGYFSGDGSKYFSENRLICDATSVNRPLLEDIQVLLSRLGIRSNIDGGFIPTCFSDLRQYKLKIEWRKSVKKFFERIGFIVLDGSIAENIKPCYEERAFSRRGIRRIVYVGKEKVYDLKVLPSEGFVANGILCHNSGSLGVGLDTGRAIALGFAGIEILFLFGIGLIMFWLVLRRWFCLVLFSLGVGFWRLGCLRLRFFLRRDKKRES